MKKLLIVGIVLTCCVLVTGHKYNKAHYEVAYWHETGILAVSPEGKAKGKLVYMSFDSLLPDKSISHITMSFGSEWSETLHVGDIVKAVRGGDFCHGEVLKIDNGYVLISECESRTTNLYRKDWKFTKYIAIGTPEP